MVLGPLKAYAAARETLLTQITNTLMADERFVAAWLTGSFGRNEADTFSDLDLTVIVDDSYGKILCTRLRQAGAGTTNERLALISTFGEPIIIHENHNNAPEEGSFTFVLYSNSALMVDWILLPHSKAQRPPASLLLFDKVGIRMSLPNAQESLEHRIEKASERAAFFWMMVAVTSKYIARQDTIQVLLFIETLQRVLREVERLVSGEAQRYQHGSSARLEITHGNQIKAIRQLCERMLKIMPEVERLGGQVSSSPMSTIEVLLNFKKEQH